MYKISRKTSVHCDVKQTFIDTMIKSIIPRNRFFFYFRTERANKYRSAWLYKPTKNLCSRNIILTIRDKIAAVKRTKALTLEEL